MIRQKNAAVLSFGVFYRIAFLKATGMLALSNSAGSHRVCTLMSSFTNIHPWRQPDNVKNLSHFRI
jgi:hypothetical protein